MGQLFEIPEQARYGWIQYGSNYDASFVSATPVACCNTDRVRYIQKEILPLQTPPNGKYDVITDVDGP